MEHLIIAAILVVIWGALTIFRTVAGRLVADECKAWAPRLTEWLIARAVARLPEDQRDFYEEHWRSDVNDIPGDLSKVFWAARCIAAANKVLPPDEKQHPASGGRIVYASAQISGEGTIRVDARITRGEDRSDENPPPTT